MCDLCDKSGNQDDLLELFFLLILLEALSQGESGESDEDGNLVPESHTTTFEDENSESDNYRRTLQAEQFGYMI